MKKKYFGATLLFLSSALLYAQNITQTVKGKVTDKDTQQPLPFTQIILLRDTAIVQSSAADENGFYRIGNIIPGRYNLKAFVMGYQPWFYPDIIVTSGKEIIFNPELEESATNLNEAVVSSIKEATTVNEMTLAGARVFSVDETNRYAGSRGDPARMASNFAGMQGTDDSRNDIVIRGNSPLGVLWRINDVDVPNPNHFAVPGTTGGGVSILNNKMFSNSDFLTGAFPAEYGNSIAGVFDLRLRNGNNERHEMTAQLGFLGTELAAEGPLSKKHSSSYLATYRYSTLKLFESLHIKIGTDAVPNYQDASFKFSFPLKNGDYFSIFGIGGISKIAILVSSYTKPTEELYGDANQDQHFGTSMAVGAASYTHAIGANSFIRFTVSQYASKANTNDFNIYRDQDYHLDSLVEKIGYTFKTGKTSFAITWQKKFNARHLLKAGIFSDRWNYDLIDSTYLEKIYQYNRRLDYNGSTFFLQPFAEWKFKINNRLVFNTGVHGQYFALNGSTSVEPRFGLRYSLSDNKTISAGAGMYSQLQPYYTYYQQVKNASGNFVQQNRQLDFSRSAHIVLGYDWMISQHLRLKLETYFMHLYDIPVNYYSSSYSILNEGAEFSRFFPDSLRNAGTGRNYGIELTAEKFFSRKYFFLFTGSLYRSKYMGSDLIERNTDFSGDYAFNALAGKEFYPGKNENTVISAGMKISYAGGRRYTPADTAASIDEGQLVEVDSLRNSFQFRNYFRFDVKLGFRINRKKVSHEIGIDIINVFNTKNFLSLTYAPDPVNPGASPLKIKYQLGFLPIFYYKIDFSFGKKSAG